MCLLARRQHGIEPPQHGEGKDHVAVLAGQVDVAQAGSSQTPASRSVRFFGKSLCRAGIPPHKRKEKL